MSFDVLILDASYKQSLASARSLGRAGLRVALGESVEQFDPSAGLPAFRSRYCAHHIILPSYAGDGTEYARGIIDFVRDNPTRVILPVGDASIASLVPHRESLAVLGSRLAVATDAALAVANDKGRTLELARRLGIDCPMTMRISQMADLAGAVAKFGFPLVLKPTVSWTGQGAERVVPVEVVDKAEAEDVARQILDAGADVLAQQWASGRREGVTMFVAGGRVLASCGHVAHRTTPPLGGASVMRESIPIPADVKQPSADLVIAMGLEGVCEVEFRRDSRNLPLLMEVNARLAGTIENSVRSGVDFPLMVWQWATETSVDVSASYRTGVRTRWLQGDLRWFRENLHRVGRPDSVSRRRSLWVFASEFARTWHYDYIDLHDLAPGVAEMRGTIASARRLVRSA